MEGSGNDIMTDSADMVRESTDPQIHPYKPPEAAKKALMGSAVATLNPYEGDAQQQLQQQRASISNFSVSSNDGPLQEHQHQKLPRRSFLMSLLSGNLSNNEHNTDISSKSFPYPEVSPTSSTLSTLADQTAPAEKGKRGLFRLRPRRVASTLLVPQRSSTSLPSSEMTRVGRPISVVRMVAGMLPAVRARKPSSVVNFLSHLQGEAGQGPQAFLVTYEEGAIKKGVPLPVSDADSILNSMTIARYSQASSAMATVLLMQETI
jgi:hypothetical protein